MRRKRDLKLIKSERNKSCLAAAAASIAMNSLKIYEIIAGGERNVYGHCCKINTSLARAIGLRPKKVFTFPFLRRSRARRDVIRALTNALPLHVFAFNYCIRTVDSDCYEVVGAAARCRAREYA
jgi:hypothetical protein